VYGFVHERDPGLADLALRQKVVLCSPFTLFAVLGVIRQAVEAHEVSRASDEILTCLSGFGEQWQRFSESLDVVAKRFDVAHRGLEDLTGTRRRQLERQLDRVEDLRRRRGLESSAATEALPHLAPVDRAG
jgi:DNA recombination protein RmuC